MKKLLYIIVFILLSGCSNNDNIDLYKEYPDNNVNKYTCIKEASWGTINLQTSELTKINTTNLIDIKEELQILNSNIVELLNKLPNNNL